MIIDKKIRYNLYLTELLNNDNSLISTNERFLFLKKLLERLCIEVTEDRTLQFPSLFSRLVYISQKFKLPESLAWNLQNIRIKSNFLYKNDQNFVSEAEYLQAKKTIEKFLSHIYEDDKNNTENLNKKFVSIKNETDYIRVHVIDINRENCILTAVENIQNSTIYIKYNVPQINDIFNTTIDKLWISAQLNIIDYKVDKQGFYIPKIFVLEPDYLIDASALSECFQYYGHTHLHYFRRRFETISNSKHILLGNLANFFLDELIFSENVKEEAFENNFIKAFKQKPFEFTSCTDIKDKTSFIDFMKKSKDQFENIKRTITQDFSQNDIDVDNCTLEPSFYCEKYGFQGRLDLLHTKDNSLKIIELKSGSLPYPKDDPTKISINHEVQTAIYQLIISTVFKNKDIVAAILYSACGSKNENIRYAASYQTLNKEIINTRNLIVATEHDLYIDDDSNCNAEYLFNEICNLSNYGASPFFFVKEINDLSKLINALSEIERSYFFRYITFISRDLYIHKVGGGSYESFSSIADLWNTNFADRLESFNIINKLEISEIDDSGKDLKITFDRVYSTDFVNFREGELCILYPQDMKEDTVLTNQILKGYIAEISNENIVLRFRYKQKNKKYFEIHKSWVIEHDYLDHGYNYMYKSLFNFFKSSKEKREIILGIKKPRNRINRQIAKEKIVTKDLIENYKEIILEKAITSSDYFLLVGPPGTGKTSQYARRLIEYYFNNTDNTILVIAYTNKAVDELCESICSSFNSDYQSCNDYIRIGTEISCNERYKHRLLQNIADGVKSREELNSIIRKQRIFVGTLASIISKPELFKIKKFSIAIIDEASQILEPQIIGILPLVEKFIMIGDHKQLSTITLQDKLKSKVNNQLLNTIKLIDCKESLFERLYRLCEENLWTENYDTLIYQGRMHIDIQNFPNKHFYNNLLQPINLWQSENLNFRNIKYTNVYDNIITKKRIAFIHAEDSFSSLLSDKVNYTEADTVIQLCKAIIDNYELNNIQFDPQQSIGIITPFRNQIALIKHKINTEKERYRELLSNIMIDTVERFQGSQRDIIIISFCMNRPYQLDLFCDWDRENKVDRKLNVAITRARKQMFLIGNKSILERVNIYKKLIEKIS